MIYKFKSAASGDVIMLGPHGDAMLGLLGREPAAKGIIETRDMPAAIATLRAAIEQAERAAAQPPAPDAGERERGHDDEPPVSLRRRLWPMIDMLERAQSADVPVVWGV
ncbi:MAG: DUF1840 domain-containing protein [Betaproteobacteria bacterium]|nr:DUF1840 domain-containing protein [Betaproteobacteria bacterium]MCC6248432.1 DUF1840 domain-containing protein [Rubrivivax sp.]MCL4696223.1 DUF1840 family protein [Burkholderiaceae bacterium]